MNFSSKPRIYAFIAVVLVLLSAGLIGVYKSNSIIEEKLAEIMATSRQRAMAFEAISLLSKSNIEGDGHAIDTLERKDIQLVIGKMEALQKALVNGDDLYQIPFTKSQELTEKILKTSPLLISSYDRLTAMLHLNGVWSTSDANIGTFWCLFYIDQAIECSLVKHRKGL